MPRQYNPEDARRELYDVIQKYNEWHPDGEAPVLKGFYAIGEFVDADGNAFLWHISGDTAEGAPPPWQARGYLTEALAEGLLGEEEEDEEEE